MHNPMAQTKTVRAKRAFSRGDSFFANTSIKSSTTIEYLSHDLLPPKAIESKMKQLGCVFRLGIN